MSGKPSAYWQNRWKKAASEISDQDVQKEIKTSMALLYEYSGAYHSPWGPWGGRFGRFFSGRWGTHHGDVVQKTLQSISACFDLSAGIGFALQEEDKKSTVTVRLLLAELKNKLGKQTLKEDGDLNRIIQTIEKNTDTQYSSVNKNEFDEFTATIRNKRNDEMKKVSNIKPIPSTRITKEEFEKEVKNKEDLAFAIKLLRDYAGNRLFRFIFNPQNSAYRNAVNKTLKRIEEYQDISTKKGWDLSVSSGLTIAILLGELKNNIGQEILKDDRLIIILGKIKEKTGVDYAVITGNEYDQSIRMNDRNLSVI